MAKSQAVYIDNILYPSLFQAMTECDFSTRFYTAYKNANGQPFRYKGRLVFSLSFLEKSNKRNKKILKIQNAAKTASVELRGLTAAQIQTLQTQILCDKNFTCETIELEKTPAGGLRSGKETK